MNDEQEVARRLGVHERWLPPLEDARMVAGAIDRGVCHIEHRGHRRPPVLVFDDGGAMELPTVRWMKTDRGERLASVSDEHRDDQTTHYDVCGTVDAIEAMIGASPEPADGVVASPANQEAIAGLLTDIEHMIERMARRRDEYDRFVADVRRLLDRGVRRKPVEPAFAWLDELRERLDERAFSLRARGIESSDRARERFVETIEAVRDVAQYLEYALSDFRETAIGIERLIDSIRGGRAWPTDRNGTETPQRTQE